MEFLNKNDFSHFDETLFSSLSEVAVYITDGSPLTIGVSKNYEQISGIWLEDVLGRNMKDVEKAGLIDKSASLLSLSLKKSVTITQAVLKSGKKVIVSSNPIFDETGNIIMVASLVYPLGLKDMVPEETGNTASPLSVIKGCIFSSSAMRQILTRVTNIAKTDATVLIWGETGVGKEVIAKIIHQISPRKDKPFIKVNMASIPAELFESELFGYRSGAFTGALKTGKTGLVQAADGGTLFLDEISEIDPGSQAKLLRLLQEKEFVPVGGVSPQKVDIRFISATNRELCSMVRSGKFREDLFYRLNVVPIYIPPLRERKDDIYSLLEFFMSNLCRRFGIKKALSPSALQLLMDYAWPGNVRELQNFVERLFSVYPQQEITESMVYEECFPHQKTLECQEQVSIYEAGLQGMVDEFEKKLIVKVLEENNGNLEIAASRMGIHRTTLLRKIRKYRLN